MTLKIGIVMDPIENINPKKDSTLAMMLAAQARGAALFYMTPSDLFLKDGVTFATVFRLTVQNDLHDYFKKHEALTLALHELDVILMRKDPPFDIEYIYTTHLLERAEMHGTRVINKPQSLRDVNEKLFIAWFPECCVPTLVTRQYHLFEDFLNQHHDIILKPLEGMGGHSIFRIRENDPNLHVILETLTHNETRFAMAQRFIPEITQGDKRILMIHGRPVPYALARIPAKGETRGNLARGATGEARPLSARDHWICERVGPVLREKGLWFVGLDVIGDYLTEINVTSPTCIRELDAAYDLDIAGDLMEVLLKEMEKA